MTYKMIAGITKMPRGYRLIIRAADNGYVLYQSPKLLPDMQAVQTQIQATINWQKKMHDNATCEVIPGTCGWDVKSKDPIAKWFPQ